MAKTLLERETLDGEEVKMILAGEELPPFEEDEPVVEEEKKVEEPVAEEDDELPGTTRPEFPTQPGPDPA